MQHNIYDATCTIENKVDIFVSEVNSLINKHEILLKAINEDRLVISKILEHLEKLEKKDNKKYEKNK